ncbi:diguanylate cyclase [Dechloromonas sp. A34]|uniref:GGDEF domain-containing protein n=1 Tax=Dechloromonas sp. A34 TaxID=447588 RepID=UPI002248E40E|nr:diguanylate cyclase [Dechloromonas sp. A34]
MADPHKLFADKVAHAYRRSGATFIHGSIVSAALSGFLLTELALLPVGLWFAFLLLTLGYHCYLGKRLLLGEKRALSGVNTRALTFFAGLAGLGWGVAAGFLPFVSANLQLLLILTLTAVAAASLPRMSALPVIHAAFMAGLFVPILIGLVTVFGVDRWMMVAVLLLIWAGLTDEARKAHLDLIEIYSTQQTLAAEAVHDKLTGIANRRSFDITFEREWLHAQRLAVPISLIMIDVDYFKKYNDRYGHQAGDECLARVAKALDGGAQRSSDLVARYGGEEFVVLLFHTTRDDGLALAEVLRRAVETLGIEHQENVGGRVTVSLGGATCVPARQESPETLLRAADTALYQAKAAGRNQIVWSSGGGLPNSAPVTR